MRVFNYALIVAGVAVALFSLAGMADPTVQRKTEIIYLLKHDCGYCHGLTLQGGLGPPLLPDQLKQFSEKQLISIIRYGRPGTPMPPWETFLTEQEAHWLAGQLKKSIEL